MLWDNSIQAVLNATAEFNLYLKLSESSVQTLLIREHCQRYHSKHDLMLSENSFQILLNVIRKSIQSAVRLQSRQYLLLFKQNQSKQYLILISENSVQTDRNG